jgi:hypothetical protein
LPVQLPTFVYFPYTRTSLGIAPDAALEYRGYVDMQFDIALTGESGSPRVLYQTPDTPGRLIDLLTRSLRRSQFRPHIADGKMVPQEGLTIRYYYTY